MHLPADIATWFKLVGALSSALGSIFLAVRIKSILKWVTYCLVSHENNIEQLINITHGKKQTEPFVMNVPKHLLDVKSRAGLVFLILGFFLLGLGLLATAMSYLVG